MCGNQITLQLPAWVEGLLSDSPKQLDSLASRMQLAVDLSAENIRQATGGPFGAIVVDQQSGELIAAGVNLVTSAGLSIAHAEMVALSMAQAKTGQWNLAEIGSLQLVTSCEPCAMCFGAIPWSGVTSVVCGAEKADAEAVGFDEGPKPEAWIEALQQRGIEVVTGVQRSEAARVLSDYGRSGAEIYSPSSASV